MEKGCERVSNPTPSLRSFLHDSERGRGATGFTAWPVTTLEFRPRGTSLRTTGREGEGQRVEAKPGKHESFKSFHLMVMNAGLAQEGKPPSFFGDYRGVATASSPGH